MKHHAQHARVGRTRKISHRKHSLIKLYAGIAVFIVVIAGIIGLMYKKNQQSQIKGYPIGYVTTTVYQTVIPSTVPSNSPKIAPYELEKYSKYGYGKWGFGSGLPYKKRLDLMPSSYTGTSATKAEKLLNFFAITDIHITDKESPAQAITMYNQGGSYSVYSGVMLYTTQVLDAAVQTINFLNKQNPFDFGISLGDTINSTQYNELRWYIDVLDGKVINPASGITSNPPPDYQQEFKAAGLDKSIPWYQVLGNHDHFWMGFLPPNDYIRKTIKGDTILNLGNPFNDPSGVDSRGYYMGSLDGRTKYGTIIGSGKDTDFITPPTIPSDNLNRRSLFTWQWIMEFFNTSSEPVGHGFTKENIENGFANYSFEPKPGIKVIVLDDTQSNDDPNDPIAMGFGKGSYGYGHGELDDKRYNWLVNELDAGQKAGQLMIIAAHIPIGVVTVPSKMGWNPNIEKKLIDKLHSYPNFILWIAGHRHFNVVTPFKSPNPEQPERGFWEVETASLRDFPQEFRTFQINCNSDNTISIFATDVDTAIRGGFPADKSRAYAIGAEQIYNNQLPLMPSGAYNAELIKKVTTCSRSL